MMITGTDKGQSDHQKLITQILFSYSIHMKFILAYRQYAFLQFHAIKSEHAQQLTEAFV